jgi:hypothetical protein
LLWIDRTAVTILAVRIDAVTHRAGFHLDVVLFFNVV